MMLPYLLCLENQFLVVWVNFSLCCSLMFSIKGQTLTWQLHMSDNYKTEIKNKCHQLFYHFWGSVWFHIDLILILLVFRKSVFWCGLEFRLKGVMWFAGISALISQRCYEQFHDIAIMVVEWRSTAQKCLFVTSRNCWK